MILAPIAAEIGIGPIHFSVIFLVGASIGFITPPYGLNLYVASSITNLPYLSLVRFIVPYFLILVLGGFWFLIALAPWLSLTLLRFM